MFKKITALTIILILAFCNLALAVTLIDFQPGEEIASSNIKIKTHGDGSLNFLTYVISSTGATSGIRYRTSAITVTIGGHKATIDISSLVGSAPSGQSIYSQIIVTKEDIISAIGEQYRNEVNTANPENINIGANIQIYNAGTGSVLATITNRDDVAKVAGKIGFGNQDIKDMQSRWQENGGSGRIVVVDPEPEGGGGGGGRGEDGKLLKPGDHGYGLRPSVLIDDDDPRYSPTSPSSVNTPYK